MKGGSTLLSNAKDDPNRVQQEGGEEPVAVENKKRKTFWDQCRNHPCRVVLVVLASLIVFAVPCHSAWPYADFGACASAVCTGLANMAGVVSVAAACYSIDQSSKSTWEMKELMEKVERVAEVAKSNHDMLVTLRIKDKVEKITLDTPKPITGIKVFGSSKVFDALGKTDDKPEGGGVVRGSSEPRNS